MKAIEIKQENVTEAFTVAKLLSTFLLIFSVNRNRIILIFITLKPMKMLVKHLVSNLFPAYLSNMETGRKKR